MIIVYFLVFIRVHSWPLPLIIYDLLLIILIICFSSWFSAPFVVNSLVEKTKPIFEGKKGRLMKKTGEKE